MKTSLFLTCWLACAVTAYGQSLPTVIYSDVPPPVVIYRELQPVYEPMQSDLVSISTLRRDNRFCPPDRPMRPSELVPIIPAPLPTRPNNPPPPVQPPVRPPVTPTKDCCDETLAKLQALSDKLDQMKATAELDAASVDALATAVAEKLKLPNLDGLVTKADLAELSHKVDQLAKQATADKLVTGQADIVALLNKLGTVDPGTTPDNALRELAIQLQRQTQMLTSLSDKTDLMVKDMHSQDGRLKNVELVLQNHTVELARLVAGVAGNTAGSVDTNKKVDGITNELRNLSIRLQRLESTPVQTLSAADQEQRVSEMVSALQEVLGGKIKLRLKFDPATGEILGADPVQ